MERRGVFLRKVRTLSRKSSCSGLNKVLGIMGHLRGLSDKNKPTEPMPRKHDRTLDTCDKK